MKKFEFSKLIAIASLLLFVCTLVIGYISMLYLIITQQENIYDLAFFATACTITGSIYMTTTKHYYSKSGLQNVTYIRNDVYEKILNVRLKFIEENIKLQKKYNVSQEDIDEIEINSPFVEISESFLSGTSVKLDEVQTLSEAEPEGEI